MFHELHPSGISLASQRLKATIEKTSGHGQSASEKRETGVQLSFRLSGERIEGLDFFLQGEVSSDEFYVAFFQAYRDLFIKKSLWQLTFLTFREWESYWRDLNHRPLIEQQELEKAKNAYEEVLSLLLKELWQTLWQGVNLSLGQRQFPAAAGWIDRLKWLTEATEHFFFGTVRVASWRAPATEKEPEVLILLSNWPQSLATPVRISLESFFQARVPGIKEIKLVAEHSLER